MKLSGGIFDIDRKRIQIEEEEQKTHAPDFWDNPKEAQKQLKLIAQLKSWTNAYDEITRSLGDLEVMLEFYRDGEASEEDVTNAYNQTLNQINDLELRNMLGKEEDALGAILKINAGAGGTESHDWAQMLMRMYLRYCERKGFRVKEIDYLAGEEAGIKSVTLEIEGEYAYGYLKSEKNKLNEIMNMSDENVSEYVKIIEKANPKIGRAHV